jgi:cyanophycinase
MNTEIRIPRLLWLLIAVTLTHLAGRAQAAEPVRGSLVIIGGGHRSAAVMERFIRLAGGPESAVILVLPMASEDAVGTGNEQVAEFHQLGVKHVRSLVFARTEAHTERIRTNLVSATGIYFTGGDQSRLAQVLVGTPAATLLLERYRSGATIGGTSAGAAIQSALMITGNELPPTSKNDGFTRIRHQQVEIVPGLGFITNAIVDQHFIARRRQNRLLAATIEHPGLLGLGIDEETAVIVGPDGQWDVLGERSVLVFDARRAQAIRTDGQGNLGARDLRLHLLLNGDQFDPGNPR